MTGTWCVGLIVMKCFTGEPAPVDSFCLLYEPVITAKGDGAITASLGVKKRLLINERKYRKFCGGSRG